MKNKTAKENEPPSEGLKDLDGKVGTRSSVKRHLAAVVEFLAVIAILCLALGVAWSPGLVFAPTPRLVLFLLLSLLIALLLGSVVARFEIKLPGVAISMVGASALVFGGTWVLYRSVKPDVQIAVFYIEDENKNKLALGADGVLEVLDDARGLGINHYTDGSALVLIFPEQVSEARIRIQWPPQSGIFYSGKLSYAGNIESLRGLGKDFERSE